eukprot:1185524-Prorocentrum_minimum.AAC.1
MPLPSLRWLHPLNFVLIWEAYSLACAQYHSSRYALGMTKPECDHALLWMIRVQMMSPGLPPGSPTHSLSPNHPGLLQSMAVPGMGQAEGSQVPSQFAAAAVASTAASGFPPSAYGHFMPPPLPAGAPMTNMKNPINKPHSQVQANPPILVNTSGAGLSVDDKGGVTIRGSA